MITNNVIKNKFFFLEKLQLCFIDAINDLYDRIIQTNKNNENCFIYRNAVKINETFFEKISFRDCIVCNNVFYKSDNL